MKLFTLILFLAPFLLGCNGDISSLINSTLFESMLKHRNDQIYKSNGFYTYNAFITAAQSFGAFGTTGDVATRKRELAAFFGQTSQCTTGGWLKAPDGPYAWGYCFIREVNRQFGDQYYGRGLIQLSYNYNYDQAGKAIGVNLLNNLDLVAIDPVISFKTAIWFWMTLQGKKPSSHDVIIGKWSPSPADTAVGRKSGYGVITNIINGRRECGHGPDCRVANRIGFYKKYSDMLGVGYVTNLDCYNQRSFA